MSTLEDPKREGTFKVKGTKRPRPVVTVDGEGVISHAGSYLLVELADRVGLTAALSRELACLQRRRRAHDPGEVLRDLAANHPATASQLFSAEGQLNRYVNVYLNDEDVRVLDGLATKVGESDTLVILPAMAGGR